MTWEQRWHPLREEWVVVTAHRDDRPWQGETVGAAARPLLEYVEDCYLCPGNARVSGEVNDRYDGVFVFDNDHPCVGPAAPAELETPAGIFRNRRADGIARVVCYSPRHNVGLAELAAAEIENLLRTWQDQYRRLGARPEVNHVLIFENKGEVVGVSNPHPHCQIYATNFVFKTIEREVQASRAYHTGHGRLLFQDILAAERADGRRIICQNQGALSFVPFFARYPYETYVAPANSHASLADLVESELADFAAVLRETLTRMDNLWRMSFPYVMVLHQAPTDGGDYSFFHFHIQIHPPLRRPGLLKYLAGPEVGGGCFLNDTAPEAKAAELRTVSAVHYTQEKCDRTGQSP